VNLSQSSEYWNTLGEASTPPPISQARAPPIEEAAIERAHQHMRNVAAADRTAAKKQQALNHIIDNNPHVLRHLNTDNQAIRALGRHLCRVIFKMLKTGKIYEIR
jgi:hypothetical protein